jgi:phosphomannomutase
MIQTNPSIFKSYDIRGIYGVDMDEESAYKIGRAYGTFIQNENQGKELTVCVSYDMRTSSPQLTEKLIAGLLDQGLNVCDIGLNSTPTMYFATAFYGFDGGIQVSASHNPKEYNGFKMVRAKAVPISGNSGINDIRDLVVKDQFVDPPQKGSLTKQSNVLDDLIKSQKEEWKIDFNKIKPLKIVIDAANAMGALDCDAIFKDLPCQLIKLNWELDGNMPIHQPDPLDEENLKMTIDAIREHKADLGICPDGDGDRTFFIDNEGNVIRQEILRGIMAQIALRDFPNSTIAYDIRPGRITRDMIVESGGKPIITRVGHSHIKESMLKENAIFGGESSGHYFYKFSYGTFESPEVLIWKFLEFVSSTNQTVAQSIAPYKKYFHSGEINSKVIDVSSTLEKIKMSCKDGELNEIDGITITYDDWWFNVRGSNTEPLIRLNLEAKTKELMEQKRDEIISLIRS